MRPVVEVCAWTYRHELQVRVSAGLHCRYSDDLHRDVVVRALEIGSPRLDLLVLVVRCDDVVYCGPVERVVAGYSLSVDVVSGSERGPAVVPGVDVLDLGVVGVAHAHDPVGALLERREGGQLSLHLGVREPGGGDAVAVSVKNIHVHAVDLLGEYLRVLVTEVAQRETIDVEAIAVVLPDAGSGESTHEQKAH